MATNNSSNIPTGNTGTVLQGQGVGTALALSTATYPATTTANQVLYSSATNVVGGITAGANGVLITSAGSVPSISSTLPSAVQGNITSTGTIASGVWNGTAVDVSYGGTGRTSLTNHGVLVGAATGAITQLAAGSAGQVLQSGGAGADPAYSTATLPTTATGTGTILRADGTNWVATTATYPTTTTINQILYSSSGDVIGGITSANNGTLITGATGIPSVLANGTTGQLLTATTGAPPSWTTVSSSGTPTKITKYTASDTWTKATSPSPILIQVLVWGGGGGGGSGRKGAASSTRRGGNGGGAGQFINYLTQASAFGASETVTIGGTAAGGSIQTTNSTDGNAGTVGNNTSVGAVVIAYGGTLGVGGNSSGTAPALTAAKQVVFSGSIYPVVSTDLVAVTGAGGSGTTSSPNMNGINGFVSMIPTGGGGGGVITSGNVVNAGGKGGDILAPDNSTAANAGGALGSGAIGGNGNAFTLNYFLYAATGGGGGGSNDAAAAYAGGTGGTPGGGGGGGGGSTNAVGDSGAGNVGARGECWIIEYF